MRVYFSFLLSSFNNSQYITLFHCSWYLWIFVVIFLVLNVRGTWNLKLLHYQNSLMKILSARWLFSTACLFELVPFLTKGIYDNSSWNSYFYQQRNFKWLLHWMFYDTRQLSSSSVRNDYKLLNINFFDRSTSGKEPLFY